MTPEDEKRIASAIEEVVNALWIIIIILMVIAAATVARADSTLVPIEKPKRQICRIDTIYVDDPRCGQLDSTYVLPHDTTIIGLIVRIDGHWEWYNWVNGKRVNMRRIK